MSGVKGSLFYDSNLDISNEGLLGTPSSPDTRPLMFLDATNKKAPAVVPTRLNRPAQMFGNDPSLKMGGDNFGQNKPDLPPTNTVPDQYPTVQPVPGTNIYIPDPNQSLLDVAGNTISNIPDAFDNMSLDNVTPLNAFATANWAFNAFNYVDNFSDMTPGQQVVGGINVVGGGLAVANSLSAGSLMLPTNFVPGLQAVSAFATVAIMMADALTGSGKGFSQKVRDSYRNRLEEAGMAYKGENGSHMVQLADGTIYDIGMDGDKRLQNKGVNIDGKTERHTFDIDHSNPVANETARYSHALSIVLFGSGSGSLMSAHLTNAATSKDPDDLGNAINNLKDLAIRSGVTYEQGVEIIKNAFKLSEYSDATIRQREKLLRDSATAEQRESAGPDDTEGSFMGGSRTRASARSQQPNADGGAGFRFDRQIDIERKVESEDYKRATLGDISRLEDEYYSGNADGAGFSVASRLAPRAYETDVITPEHQEMLLEYWYKLWFEEYQTTGNFNSAPAVEEGV